jgi:hypothetical protein
LLALLLLRSLRGCCCDALAMQRADTHASRLRGRANTLVSQSSITFYRSVHRLEQSGEDVVEHVRRGRARRRAVAAA